MKHFFVLGNETSKSLSPTIFNHWFKKHKIKAKYTFLEVKKKRNLNKALLNKLKEKNICGYNITMPYKKDVFAYLDKKNTHSNKIGAVNCVVVKKKSTGINTDWIGYLRSIRGLGINKNKKILVLGYGGASMAIVYGFLSKGYKDIVVLNRSKKQINFNGLKTYTKKYSCLGEHLSNADLIINTTPTNQIKKKTIKDGKKNNGGKRHRL